MRKLIPLCFVIAATSGGATDCGQIIDDPGFDVWCGDSLCRWDVEKGDVARAATWHEADNGVELVGADVSIAQITEVTSTDGHCIAFELIADVADDAEVHLQMDVFGDGSIELDERLPTSDWRALSYRVRMPDFYQGVRFRLTKRGGHAVLANIGARTTKDAECAGAALAVGTRPDGVACTEDAQCTSGTCWPGFFGGVCGECKTDADCGGATPVCGVVDTAEAHLGLWTTCVAAGSAEVNAQCLVDAQCGTGTCAGGACSVCNDTADCGGGACVEIEYAVEHADGGEPTIVKGASHCAAGGTVAAGGACVDDADCSSGACNGDPLGMCTTTWLPRRCADDMECPGYGFGDEHACVTVGTRGGVCQ